MLEINNRMLLVTRDREIVVQSDMVCIQKLGVKVPIGTVQNRNNQACILIQV